MDMKIAEFRILSAKKISKIIKNEGSIIVSASKKPCFRVEAVGSKLAEEIKKEAQSETGTEGRERLNRHDGVPGGGIEDGSRLRQRIGR
ncbi:MAG: hypothetical protein Q8O98_02180 [bacterium]|nr:hypothetical protein [bacterium]